ncbi:MAG: ABC transporter permease [Anaerolineae bacterium]|nr:ABC transporter permease [Anaerolineae bacterium]
MNYRYRIWLLIVAGFVLIAPQLAPVDPLTIDYQAVLTPPSSHHLLGTDQLGRDVLSRLLHGGQRTLLMTTAAAALALITGTITGIAAGWFGGMIDGIIKTVLNALLAIPGLMIAMVVITMLGQGIISIILATALVQITPTARIIRAQAIISVQADYVTGAVALGATPWYILRVHILAGCLPVILTWGSVSFGYCLLNIGALGFLGLAGEPGLPEWGVMLAEGREVFREGIWVGAAPGIAITFTVLAVNWLADRFNQRE